ncbi:hypothetical protein B0H12DRAFT_541389 [Mycena haematopus]|nr:hypothetical protein B0H12DRAFT_541389 [Mycena haematopus]
MLSSSRDIHRYLIVLPVLPASILPLSSTMSIDPLCNDGEGILANPELSGIGVRAAIYVQSLLGFVPAISALWDGEVAQYELEAVATQSSTILITAFSILISAMVEAKALKVEVPVSAFYANIVLNLAWMNNTNTFIYFLLYIQQRSQLGPRQISSDLFSAWKHIKSYFSGGISSAEKAQKTKDHGAENNKKHNTEIEQRSLFSAIFRVEVRGDVAIALLGSLHLSMMSAFGIWLWSDPSSFGTATGADACAVQLSSYVLLGKHVPLGSNTLRICSLIIYSTFLMPGSNLLLPLASFVTMLFVYRAFHGKYYAHKFDPSSKRNFRGTQESNAKIGLTQSHSKGLVDRSLWVFEAWYNPFLVPVIVGMVFLFAINLVFIINIELTLRANQALRSSGESLWSFGQILAMLLMRYAGRHLQKLCGIWFGGEHMST